MLLTRHDDLTPDRLQGVAPYRADEAGRVRVPEPGRLALVRASMGALRGYEVCGGLFDPDLRIELAEPVQLVVAVEDGTGFFARRRVGKVALEILESFADGRQSSDF